MKHQEISSKIINAFYTVYNTLGYGFLIKVYEKAMIFEFRKIGLDCKNQFPIEVIYDNQVVGEYYADLLVEDKIIVELKAIKKLTNQDEAQLLAYLTATNIEVGLLLNFGEKPEFKRKIYDNDLKKYIKPDLSTDEHR